MPLPVQTFSELIVWLAARYHEGVILRMSPRTGISQAMLQRWRHGQVEQPMLSTIRKLCAAYGLTLTEVLALLDKPIRGAGAASVPLPTRPRRRHNHVKTEAIGRKYPGTKRKRSASYRKLRLPWAA